MGELIPLFLIHIFETMNAESISEMDNTVMPPFLVGV